VKSAVLAMLAVLALVSVAVAAPPMNDPDTVVAETRQELLDVERLLRWHDVSQLTAEQRAARRRALDELHRYAIAGVFPHNHTSLEAKPIFVDEHGTLCAFANLLAFSGRSDFVKHVAASHNDAKVADLAEDPEIVSWSRETGISIDEASSIQRPAYPITPREEPIAPTSTTTRVRG